MKHKTYRDFSPYAADLRSHFDKRFAEPRRATADRFVWDYWHVPGQYSFLRTPAFDYFPPALYRKFHTHLVKWGRETLGCHDVSPTWLSAYIEGCHQRLHRDQPHGPLAFVLSLTNWRTRKFTGGETTIERENKFGLESAELFEFVAGPFNQLLLFDPAKVHGVEEVRGVRDPRDARLVLHGWFVQPRVFWTGPLRTGQVESALGRAWGQVAAIVPDTATGFCSWRLKISAAGAVEEVRLIAETLGESVNFRAMRMKLRGMRFPKSRGATTLTLPLSFS